MRNGDLVEASSDLSNAATAMAACLTGVEMCPVCGISRDQNPE